MTKREKKAHAAAAQRELDELRSSLCAAYQSFNMSADQAIVEASILEIGALQARYGRLLRDFKSFNEVS